MGLSFMVLILAGAVVLAIVVGIIVALAVAGSRPRDE
jgi:hypothetical protein